MKKFYALPEISSAANFLFLETTETFLTNN